MLPSAATPHLEASDLKEQTQVAADRLRTAAVRAQELGPVIEQLNQARRLLLCIRGFIASSGLDMPADADQELFAWLHQDALARKGRKP